jgi:hypothetical protein
VIESSGLPTMILAMMGLMIHALGHSTAPTGAGGWSNRTANA